MNRGLTREQAEQGVQPPVLTRAEWDAMWLGSMEAERSAHNRHAAAFAKLWRTHDPRA